MAFGMGQRETGRMRRGTNAGWRSFSLENRGAAAIELALVVPFMAAGFMAMVDVGEAIKTKYGVEQKMRLAIEGVQRYGENTTQVIAFANADGNAAFSGQNNAPTNTSTVTITPYYLCRASDGTTAKYSASANATCPDYETWYSISASGSSTGIFGKDYNITTTVDLMAN